MFSSTESTSSKREKRKHITLTLNQKLEIIERLEKGESRKSLSNEFNVGSSTIYDIKTKKDELIKFATQSVTTEALASRQTLKKPKLEQLDSELYKWFSAVRSEGQSVTGPMIVEKAKEIGQNLGVVKNECNYSHGWLRNFKFRHGIRKLDIAGEILSANPTSMNEYKDEFEKSVALSKELDVARGADNKLKKLPKLEVEERLLIENEPIVQLITDEDIMNIVAKPEPTQKLEERHSVSKTEENEKISWEEAAESLNKFICFAEASTSYSASEIIEFHIIRNKFHDKHQKSRNQEDIRDFFKSE